MKPNNKTSEVSKDVYQFSNDEIYTVETLAVKLSVSERTIRDTILSKKLKAFKKFTRWYILHTDLLDFLKS